jgi:hypothetical protein
MDIQEKALYHQIHPAKLATDWFTALLAAYFLWQGDLVLALAIGFVPAIVASVLVIRYADLGRYQASAFGHYVAKYMTPLAMGFRVVGLVVFWTAAWYHSISGVVAGLLIVLDAWGYGLFLMRD